MASLEVSDVWKETRVMEGYWVGRCALMEVSEGKTVLLIRKYNALIVRASFMSIPQQSLQNVTSYIDSVHQELLQNVTSYIDSIHQELLQNVTVSPSSHCRMLQYPPAVTAECYSIPQHSLQNVTVSLSSQCQMLPLPHDHPPAVTAECYSIPQRSLQNVVAPS